VECGALTFQLKRITQRKNRIVATMADPITIVGTLASAVQLANAVVVTSKELYNFFAGVKHAFRDAERLRLSLRDLEAIAASVHNSNIHHETLPEVVSTLKSCYDELNSLHTIVNDAKSAETSQSSVKRLGKRISWVFEEKKIQDSVKRLEILKANLSIALLSDIRRTQHTNDTSFANFSQDMYSFRDQNTAVQNNIANKLSSLESQLSRFTMSADSFYSESNIQAEDDDKFARALRKQLSPILREGMEECLSRARKELKGWLRKEFEHVPDALEQVLKSLPQYHDVPNPPQNPSPPNVARFSEDFTDECHRVSETYHCDDQASSARSSFTSQGWYTEWNTWTYKWTFGRFTVSIGTMRNKTTKTYKTRVEFLPAAWIFSRGITFSYTLYTDQRGYPTICPMLSTFAVVPVRSEQFILVKRGDIHGLRRMFSMGLAAPTDRTYDYGGGSLLHVSDMALYDF
jgi:hypothetical protein